MGDGTFDILFKLFTFYRNVTFEINPRNEQLCGYFTLADGLVYRPWLQEKGAHCGKMVPIFPRLEPLVCPTEEEEEEADREVDELFQEAHMPLDQLMAKYTGGGGGGAAEKKDKPAAAGVARLRSKDKGKALSPFLRAKAGGSGSSEHL